jgi:hypothetical protein
MARKSIRQKARETNVAIFGRASDNDPKSLARYTRPVPKNKREFAVLIGALDSYIEDQYKGMTDKSAVSQSHLIALKKLFDMAVRDNVENISTIFCPVCKEEHYIACDSCGTKTEIKVPSEKLEKNSLEALKTLANKMMPNLAAISMDIDVNHIISGVPDIVGTLIVKYVPVEKQHEALTLANEKMGKLFNVKELEPGRDYEVDSGENG